MMRVRTSSFFFFSAQHIASLKKELNVKLLNAKICVDETSRFRNSKIVIYKLIHV